MFETGRVELETRRAETEVQVAKSNSNLDSSIAKSNLDSTLDSTSESTFGLWGANEFAFGFGTFGTAGEDLAEQEDKSNIYNPHTGWTRIFMHGVEGDPDCGSWHNPDGHAEYILEILLMLPLLHLFWSNIPEKYVMPIANTFTLLLHTVQLIMNIYMRNLPH